MKKELILRNQFFLDSMQLVQCIWHQGYVTGTFDCYSQSSLMLCTCTGNSSRKNFTSFRHITFQFCNIFVINALNLVDAEGANLPALAVAAISISFNSQSLDLLMEKLERQIAIVIVQFREIGRGSGR